MPPGISVRVRGVKRTRQKLSGYEKEYRSALAAAELTEANACAKRSQELVPVDTGDLKDSIYVRVKRGKNTRVLVGYGAWYAAIVHQMVEKKHERGQSKYLEAAVNESKSGYAQRVASLVDAYRRAKITTAKVGAPFPKEPRNTGRKKGKVPKTELPETEGGE